MVVVELEDREVVLPDRRRRRRVRHACRRVRVGREADGLVVPERDRLGLPGCQTADRPRPEPRLVQLAVGVDQVRVVGRGHRVVVEEDERRERQLRRGGVVRDRDHERDVLAAALQGRLNGDGQRVGDLGGRGRVVRRRHRGRGSRCHRRAHEGCEQGDKGHRALHSPSLL